MDHAICCFGSIVQATGKRDIYAMEPHETSRSENDMMNYATLPEKRADRRFSFFADAEVTLCDGTSVPTQLAELSSRGCYVGTLVPIPIGTEFRIRIWDGVRTCELPGKVIYLHSCSGLGIFGMGVQLEKTATADRSVIDAWLYDLAGKRVSPTPQVQKSRLGSSL